MSMSQLSRKADEQELAELNPRGEQLFDWDPCSGLNDVHRATLGATVTWCRFKILKEEEQPNLEQTEPGKPEILEIRMPRVMIHTGAEGPGTTSLEVDLNHGCNTGFARLRAKVELNIELPQDVIRQSLADWRKDQGNNSHRLSAPQL
jgi:hypothetical protein